MSNLQAPDPKSYLPLIELARREDLGSGDVTSEITIPAERQGNGRIVFREEGILCGLEVAREVLKVYEANLQLESTHADGEKITAGDAAGRVSGSLRGLLAAERVMLNFLQRLSGIATITSKYVKAVEGTDAEIFDTRKTTPGWRELEKHAVCCGGGHNHRSGLYDGVLIKDNHLETLGREGIAAKLKEAVGHLAERSDWKGIVEVEVDSLEQLEEVLTVGGVDMVLLDNMTPDQLSKAVQKRNQVCPGRDVQLEASGGITLDNVREIARTGVERISVGALTHAARSLDISLELSK